MRKFGNLHMKFEALVLEAGIGEGGYGRVYRARHEGQIVAAKVFRSKERNRITRDFSSELFFLSRLGR